jgi:hypothetical protein
MKPLLISLLAILLLGCGPNANNTNTGFKMADSSTSNPVPVDTTRHQQPNNTTNITPTQNNPTSNPTSTVSTPTTSENTSADLPSILSSSTIKFDENFNPVATITLHNTTTKEIDQIMFRFTFTNHSLSDGPINLVAASDYSSYVNYSLQLHPPDSQTIEITVPQPKMKAFDTPNIFITKVRYFDGTVDSDDR